MNLPPIAENLFAPEMYADAASFFGKKNGNFSITFTSLRFDNSTDPGLPRSVVIGRVVMTTAGALGLADEIYAHLEKERQLPNRATAN